jgi:MoaA/NifB/PqqE/SkfB family radical SAM enzyme
VSATWDLTYACQLRCGYCYSESGRRASSILPHAELLRIADALAEMGVRTVQLSGGEPLLVGGLPEIVEHLRARGAKVMLYTNGLLVNDESAAELGRMFSRIRVCVDGATAAVHDRVRGREGAFRGAIEGLHALDRAAAARRIAGEKKLRFGLETIVVQTNFGDMEAICGSVAPLFPELSFVRFGAAIPAGPANSEGYAETELLTPDQIGALRDPAFSERLRARLPASVKELAVMDNFDLATTGGEAGEGLLHVEADGSVRSMIMYEGTVGNLLRDEPGALWERILERRTDPTSLARLSAVKTLGEWAVVAREVDWQHASEETRTRIQLRRKKG